MPAGAEIATRAVFLGGVMFCLTQLLKGMGET